MTTAAFDYGVTYTRDETIFELEGYDNGARISPIEVAVSSLYWLEQAERPNGFEDTIAALREWLVSADPELPDGLIGEALGHLRDTEER